MNKMVMVAYCYIPGKLQHSSMPGRDDRTDEQKWADGDFEEEHVRNNNFINIYAFTFQIM
jgi:hypothetical protein